MFRSTLAVASLTSMLAVPSAMAEEQIAITSVKAASQFYPFLYSARGPGSGKTSVGVGGRVLFILPMLDVQLTHGLTDRLDFEARLSTIGLLNLGDLGLRLRLLGEESFSLGLRGDVSGLFVGFATADLAAGVGAVGVTPGVILSMGSASTQVSLILDAPMFFGTGVLFAAEGETGAAGGTYELTPILRPQVAVEFAVGKETSLYLMAQAYVVGPVVLPFFGLGAVF